MEKVCLNIRNIFLSNKLKSNKAVAAVVLPHLELTANIVIQNIAM